jgi:hypothetical protein
MLAKILAFLTPSAIVLAIFAAGFGIVAARGHRIAESPARLAPGQVEPEHLPDLGADRIVLPAPALTPDEVVRTQLAGLADANADGIGILQCYVFASPGNRRVTGPLDRFGAMVRQGAFSCFASPHATLVGRPDIEGPVAKILVSIIDRQGRMQAFTFILSKQRIEPHQDCWMTEAVIPLGGLAPPAEERGPTRRDSA